MATHTLQLAAIPFRAIVSGQKTIESRLYDDKRQQIKLGDTLTFVNREFPNQIVSVKVIGLLRYNTFDDLFTHNNPAKFGGKSIEWLKDQIDGFYSLEEQLQNGVIGIEFRIIK